MAYPASQQTLQDALEGIAREASRIKFMAQSLRSKSATSDTPRRDFTNFQKHVDSSIDRWQTLGSVPGLAAYAQEQYGDGSLDIVAEYMAMRNAAIALRDWIFSNIPRDAGSGAVLLEQIDQNGNIIDLTVTPAQSAGFRTEADAFIATIG